MDGGAACFRRSKDAAEVLGNVQKRSCFGGLLLVSGSCRVFSRRVGKDGVLFEPHVARVLDQGFDHRHHDHPTLVSRFVFDASRRSSASPTSMGVRMLQQRIGRMWPPQPRKFIRLWTTSVGAVSGPSSDRSVALPFERSNRHVRVSTSVRDRWLLVPPVSQADRPGGPATSDPPSEAGWRGTVVSADRSMSGGSDGPHSIARWNGNERMRDPGSRPYPKGSPSGEHPMQTGGKIRDKKEHRFVCRGGWW